MAGNCVWTPDCKGDHGTLFKEILNVVGKKNRLLAEFIFVSYLVNGVATQMDNLGKNRNSFGNHSGKDVCAFFNSKEAILELGNIKDIEVELGVIDQKGKILFIQDVVEAMQKVEEFNRDHTGLIASVVKVGDKYRYKVERRDVKTSKKILRVKEANIAWKSLEQIFNSKGFDLNELANNMEFRWLFDPTSPLDVTNYLSNLQKSNHGVLTKKDIALLFHVGKNDLGVQRLVTKYRSLEDAIDTTYRAYREQGLVSDATKTLMDNTLSRIKKFNGLDFHKITEDLKSIVANAPLTGDRDLQTQIEGLKGNYAFGVKTMELTGELDSLSKVAAEATTALSRQIKHMEMHQGITDESKRLRITLNQLLDALSGKRFYAGCLNFLKEAVNQNKKIDELLENISQGITMEDLIKQSDSLMEIKRIVDEFKNIVAALTYFDITDLNENISTADIQILKEEAKKINDFYEEKEKIIKKIRLETISNLLINILGDTLPNGNSVADLAIMMENDGSIFDFLYSVGRVSNPVIASFGTIIKDAQDSRDAVFDKFARRIREATHKLYKAGHNSSFMFEENGYIISDIDWDAYFEERRVAYAIAKKNGLAGVDLKVAMDAWEYDATEERVVDQKTGRTERVPKHRKPFPNLTPAQKEYYNTMMQLKGELGTLLPHYAQKHYLPPQIRRDLLDGLTNAKSAKELVTSIWDKFSEIWKIREDDDAFNDNGIIDGEEYGVMQGGLDNTPIRQIPIFYINKLKHREEQLHDFSSCLQLFAHTAVNYDAMNKVRSLLEVVQIHIDGVDVQYNKNGVPQVEVTDNNLIRIVKRLRDIVGPGRSAFIINSFMESALFGEKNKGGKDLSKIAGQYLAYNSIKVLALNLLGIANNLFVGLWHMIIEAGGKEFYNLGDLIWAAGRLFWDNTVGMPAKIVDFLNNDKSSYDFLLAEKFGFIPGKLYERGHKRYYKNFLRKIIGTFNPLAGYSITEAILHYLSGYAILHNRKVLVNDKKIPLFYAFQKAGNKDNPSLELKPGVTDLQGNLITEEDLKLVRGGIETCAQECHGSMNDEASGVVHQYWQGKAVFNLRKWWIEAASRRFRGLHWDAGTKSWRSGYMREGYVNMFKRPQVVLGVISELLHMRAAAVLSWGNLSNREKANVRKTLTGLTVCAALYLLKRGAGNPDEYKRKWWRRMWILLTNKSLNEMASMEIPIVALINTIEMWNTVLPSARTFYGLLYPLIGVEDIGKTRKRTKSDKTTSVYWHNVKKETIPFWKDVNRWVYLAEEDDMFKFWDDGFMHYSK